MKYLLISCLLVFQTCWQQTNPEFALANRNIFGEQSDKEIIDPSGNTIRTRFLTPEGFNRTDEGDNSFQEYLRTLPLKPDGSKVKIYDGRIKENNGVYDAVVDLKIGTRNLHQCADAVIRLRAEYLYKQGQFDKIHFNFTNGFRVNYSEWMQGKRIVVDGNRTWWKQKAPPSNTYKDFWKYMEIIYTYAGTLSLSSEMQYVSIENIEIGDVFIKGGSPGHAIIVVDMAVNEENRMKIFLLAQSYMPAQELQVLQNPNNKELSPWFASDFGEQLRTPEWTFRNNDLKRFVEE